MTAMIKQPEDPERSVSGNARQRRRVVRQWKAKGLRVRHFGRAGQFLVDVPAPRPTRTAAERRVTPKCGYCHQPDAAWAGADLVRGKRGMSPGPGVEYHCMTAFYGAQ